MSDYPIFDLRIGRRSYQLRALDQERERERDVHTHPPSVQSIQLPVSLPDRLFLPLSLPPVPREALHPARGGSGDTARGGCGAEAGDYEDGSPGDPRRAPAVFSRGALEA